ncbi:MAG: ATP-binding protein [Bacteroidota bacterium]
MVDHLEFKISSGLKSIIGRDLITDDFIAVFELVKNAYDAHATCVEITFGTDKIIIKDNGKGMSLSDIKDKWLFVAYSAKKENEEDSLDESGSYSEDYINKIRPKNYYAGAKGIGRFSCDRLGKKLTLITKSRATNSKVEIIDVKWKDFEEDVKKEFVKIPVSHKTSSISGLTMMHGTRLKISGLYSDWSRKKLQKLKYSLEKLINPFDALEANDSEFNITIVCDREKESDREEDFERDKVNGSVNNFIFETLNIKTTQIKTQVSEEAIETELIDRGSLIYKIREPNAKYNLLKDARFHLFFLNKAAKNNFTRQMGIQPIQFGSVFLFKNGFRVYPFGNPEDDSLGMDSRKQQGFARFLGTRDLLGRIELFSDDSEEFREVSSRDGGLVETKGYGQLVESFYDTCLKRLERYVVDVQWGQGLPKEVRDKLGFKEDTEKEDISFIEKTVESRGVLINTVKKLVDRENVEVIDYNRDLIDITHEKIEKLRPNTFKDLLAIAEKTGDYSFKKEILDADKKYQKLLDEKTTAEKKAQEELEKRQRAEDEAKKAGEAKRIEEERRKKAEEARRKAELEAKEKELQRREAELKRKEAEQKAKNAEKAKHAVEASLKSEKEKNKYLNATRKTLSDDAEELIHSIKLSATEIDACLDALNRKIKEGLKDDEILLEEIGLIRFQVDKVLKVSSLVTKANFKSDQEVQKVNLPDYVEEYFSTYSYAYKDKIKIQVNNDAEFRTKLSLLDVSLILDNLISNSQKAGAINIIIDMLNSGKCFLLDFHDDGKGVPEELASNNESLFSLGTTTTDGSGIGLYTIKNKMKSLRGEVQFLGNGKKLKGASFRLVFK